MSFLNNTIIMSLRCSLGDISMAEIGDFASKLHTCFNKTNVFSFESSKSEDRYALKITRHYYIAGCHPYFCGDIKKGNNTWELAGTFNIQRFTLPLFFSFYVSLFTSLALFCIVYFSLEYHDLLKPILGCVFALTCVFLLHKKWKTMALNASFEISRIIKDCIKSNLQNYLLDI